MRSEECFLFLALEQLEIKKTVRFARNYSQINFFSFLIPNSSLNYSPLHHATYVFVAPVKGRCQLVDRGVSFARLNSQ